MIAGPLYSKLCACDAYDEITAREEEKMHRIERQLNDART